MKNSLTCQSSAGFAGNTVFITRCLQKAKLLPTSGCVDRSFIIIIIIALLGVIIDHHHHHHYTPGHGHPLSSLVKHSVPAVPWCCSVALRGGGDSLAAQGGVGGGGGVEDVQVELQGWVFVANAPDLSFSRSFELE